MVSSGNGTTRLPTLSAREQIIYERKLEELASSASEGSTHEAELEIGVIRIQAAYKGSYFRRHRKELCAAGDQSGHHGSNGLSSGDPEMAVVVKNTSPYHHRQQHQNHHPLVVGSYHGSGLLSRDKKLPQMSSLEVDELFPQVDPRTPEERAYHRTLSSMFWDKGAPRFTSPPEAKAFLQQAHELETKELNLRRSLEKNLLDLLKDWAPVLTELTASHSVKVTQWKQVSSRENRYRSVHEEEQEIHWAAIVRLWFSTVFGEEWADVYVEMTASVSQVEAEGRSKILQEETHTRVQVSLTEEHDKKVVHERLRNFHLAPAMRKHARERESRARPWLNTNHPEYRKEHRAMYSLMAPPAPHHARTSTLSILSNTSSPTRSLSAKKNVEHHDDDDQEDYSNNLTMNSIRQLRSRSAMIRASAVEEKRDVAREVRVEGAYLKETLARTRMEALSNNFAHAVKLRDDSKARRKSFNIQKKRHLADLREEKRIEELASKRTVYETRNRHEANVFRRLLLDAEDPERRERRRHDPGLEKHDTMGGTSKSRTEFSSLHEGSHQHHHRGDSSQQYNSFLSANDEDKEEDIEGIFSGPGDDDPGTSTGGCGGGERVFFDTAKVYGGHKKAKQPGGSSSGSSHNTSSSRRGEGPPRPQTGGGDRSSSALRNKFDRLRSSSAGLVRSKTVPSQEEGYASTATTRPGTAVASGGGGGEGAHRHQSLRPTSGMSFQSDQQQPPTTRATTTSISRPPRVGTAPARRNHGAAAGTSKGSGPLHPKDIALVALSKLHHTDSMTWIEEEKDIEKLEALSSYQLNDNTIRVFPVYNPSRPVLLDKNGGNAAEGVKLHGPDVDAQELTLPQRILRWITLSKMCLAAVGGTDQQHGGGERKKKNLIEAERHQHNAAEALKMFRKEVTDRQEIVNDLSKAHSHRHLTSLPSTNSISQPPAPGGGDRVVVGRRRLDSVSSGSIAGSVGGGATRRRSVMSGGPPRIQDSAQLAADSVTLRNLSILVTSCGAIIARRNRRMRQALAYLQEALAEEEKSEEGPSVQTFLNISAVLAQLDDSESATAYARHGAELVAQKLQQDLHAVAVAKEELMVREREKESNTSYQRNSNLDDDGDGNANTTVTRSGSLPGRKIVPIVYVSVERRGLLELAVSALHNIAIAQSLEPAAKEARRRLGGGDDDDMAEFFLSSEKGSCKTTHNTALQLAQLTLGKEHPLTLNVDASGGTIAQTLLHS